jgi:hypothetical protein
MRQLRKLFASEYTEPLLQFFYTQQNRNTMSALLFNGMRICD